MLLYPETGRELDLIYWYNDHLIQIKTVIKNGRNFLKTSYPRLMHTSKHCLMTWHVLNQASKNESPCISCLNSS